MVWLFVPGLEDSNWDSISPSPNIELFVTASGKPSLRPLSWRGWQTRPWIRLLSGTTLPPSTADRGVASFISSLRATPASPGAMPASERDTKTSGSCLMTLPELSERWSPSLYSLKMLQEQLTFDSIAKPSSKAWATELRRDYSQRLKWGRRTGGSESFCWRTPQGQEPQINPDKLTGEDGHRKYNKETGRLAQYSVTQQAANWPTPASRDVKGDYLDESMIRKDGKSRMDLLPNVASRFSLQDQQTSTPGEKCFNAGPNSNLPWPSPRAQKLDKLESNTRNATGKGKKLNPRFVEWLMGLPFGMTDFDVLETPWSRLLPRWRSELYGED